MAKKLLNPTTALYPLPVVMVTTSDPKRMGNIITIAWTGILCSEPPMVGISVRPQRYSYPLIQESKEFVINIPTENLTYATDYCGTYSGRDTDKFAALNLTPVPARMVQAPLIKECPVNLECRVTREVSLGSHQLFIAEVVAIHADEEVLSDSDQIQWEETKPVAYCRGRYVSLGRQLGKHGFSRAQNQ